MKQIYDRDTLSLVSVRKKRKLQDIRKFALIYGLFFLAVIVLTIIIYAWIMSPCASIDWMTVYITVKGHASTVTTPEYVPVCIPQP